MISDVHYSSLNLAPIEFDAYVIDGASGRVLFHATHYDAVDPGHPMLVDNWLTYTYVV